MDTPVLSNVWCPVLTSHPNKTLSLWLNSTLGLLILLSHREETEGAWIDFKKPVLSEMPVLNVGSLAPTQMDRLVKAYDTLSTVTSSLPANGE